MSRRSTSHCHIAKNKCGPFIYIPSIFVQNQLWSQRGAGEPLIPWWWARMDYQVGQAFMRRASGSLWPTCFHHNYLVQTFEKLQLAMQKLKGFSPILALKKINTMWLLRREKVKLNMSPSVASFFFHLGEATKRPQGGESRVMCLCSYVGLWGNHSSVMSGESLLIIKGGCQS